MIIALGADHAAFEEKEQIKGFLEGCGHTVIDKGTHTADSVDYPEFGHAVGKAVVNKEAEKGIVICGSGIGISISANKVNGIRAALCTTVEHAKLSRQHNLTAPSFPTSILLHMTRKEYKALSQHL